MTDIYAVDDIVEHIDYLRYDRRKRELEKQLADRLSAEKRFIFFHLITPMRTKNEQSNYITALPVVKWEKEKALRRVFEANLADPITRWEHNKFASEVS